MLAELANDYRAAYARPFAAIEPEVVALVMALREAGLRLGIITNASDLDTAPWPRCRLAPCFDDVVVSHRVGLLKPDPRIYALACRRLDVQPAEAAFVGDGGSEELAGAERAGLAAWWSSWFLERWPEGRRPNSFPSDGWRQYAAGGEPPYPRLAGPSNVLARVTERF